MPSKPWADGPWALLETPSKAQDVTAHPALHIANEMANAHNCMLRGLNAMYLQAPQVAAGTADAADLLFLAATWAAWIAHHHRMEEEDMFPGFEAVLGRPGALTRNAEQHHAFAPALSELQTYAAGDGAAAGFDGTAFRAMLEALAPPLREHLADEIGTLTAMRELCGEDEEARAAKGAELLKVYVECEAAAGKQDMFAVGPMVMGLRDKTYEGGNAWPKLPGGSIAEYVIAYGLSLKHRGSWRFLPCDHFGQPRELAFLGKEE